MTVVINGTNGITNDGGYTGDGVSFADTTPANTLVTTTGGNVGVGTSSPGTKLEVAGAGTFKVDGAGSTTPLVLRNNNTASTQVVKLAFDSNGAVKASINAAVYGNDYMTFNVGSDTERARIDSSGNLLVGYSSGGPAHAAVVKANGYNTKAGYNAVLGGNVFNIQWSGSTASLYIDATNVGNISLTSDYRIKRNIETQDAPALDRVMQLRPVTYQMADYGELFKASDAIKEGFIAHELQEVIPSAVDGVKDDPNQIQSLKLDALVSVLTKAIQEQQAIITALTARVAALEGTQP